MLHLSSQELEKTLKNSGLVKEEELRSAKNESLRTGRIITEILIGRGVISEKLLAENISDFLHVPIANLERIKFDTKLVERIPENFAKGKGVVLFRYNEKEKTGDLGMIDPNDFETVIYLQHKLGIRLNIHLITQASLKFALKYYRKKIGEDFNKIIEENLAASQSLGGEAIDINKLAEAIPIIKILDTIIENAASLSASDIHFEPFRDKLLVRYRIDGILNEILTLPKTITPLLIARVKVVANLQIDIHNAPQDGRFRFPLDDQFVDIRVSILPTFHGEKAEMRLLKGSLRPLSLSELGLSKNDFGKLNDAIKKPHGLILVTGPTGAGKSTTLYAILEILNTPKVNITTVEDPIEYDIPRVNQTQVNAKAGLTFATGLRTIVRQNPDIIMIGEIRDTETADIAVNAALTGHLLLSTLHTNDAPTAIPRLTEMNIQPFLIASTLNIVIAQRLVRKLCTTCISSHEIEKHTKELLLEQVKELGINESAIPKTFYASRGCAVCGFDGFRGQVAIFEILYISDAIRQLILKNASAQEIAEVARKEGMQPLLEDGLEKVAAGLTTIEEILRVASE